SKLVRVRSEELKNTSAIDLPLSSSPNLLRLKSAACVSRASRSGRDQSCVFRKCLLAVGLFEAGFIAVSKNESKDVAGPEKQKSPARRLGFSCVMPSFERRRVRRYPARSGGNGRRAREVMPAAIQA